MRKALLIALFILFAVTALFAQSTLLLINGKEKAVKSWRADKEKNKVYYIPSDSGKEKTLSLERVYSVNRNGKPDTVLYFRDSLEGNELTQEQMYEYIQGMQHARKVYRSFPSFLGGVVADALGMPLLKFWGSGLPVVYTLFVSIRQPRIKDEAKLTAVQAASPYFAEGYRVMGKRIKIRNALIGGLIGTAGAIVYQMTL